MTMQSKAGFSFLEIALVLAVIGLLFGAITFGGDLLGHSRNQKLVAEIMQHKSSFSSFINKHQALPGDMVKIAEISDRGTGLIAGNGNFVIDNDTEEMQVWVHLANAGLIEGVYSGLIADRYTISKEAVLGGVPGTEYSDIGGYGVIQNSENLELRLANYSASNNSLSIISPERLGQIDLKIDDGKPSSGGLIAVDGSGDSGCITGGEYSASSSELCIAQLAMYRNQITKAASTAESCSGATIGDFALDSIANCAANKVGSSRQTCNNTSSGTATNRDDAHCRLEECQSSLDVANVNSALTKFNGLSTQQTVAICPNHYSNYSEVDCNSGGSLTYTTACTVDTSQNCDSNQTMSVPCDFDQKGIRPLYCSGGTWTVDVANSTCSAIESGDTVGVSRTTVSCSSANADYTGNIYYEAAIAPSSVTIPSDPVFNDRIATNEIIAFNECLPDYTSIAGCSGGAGTIVDIGCPPGERGGHLIRCTSAVASKTIANNCEPVTCNGAALRSIRVSAIGKQSRTDNCMPLQVCALVAADRAMWVEAKGQCHNSAGRCASFTDTSYYTDNPSFSSVEAGNTNTPSCDTLTGYSRICLDNGIWGPVVDGGEACR